MRRSDIEPTHLRIQDLTPSLACVSEISHNTPESAISKLWDRLLD